ncbi:MAG: hypothetical protein EOM03_14425 [Clostridia bacterium]|nr:hypothetical protein [Clostridia bacterium]
MNEKQYTLCDVFMKLVGDVGAVGDSYYDGKTIENLENVLPQICDVVARVFKKTAYECGRHEGSVQEIGELKLKWAKEIKDLIDDVVYRSEPEKEADA